MITIVIVEDQGILRESLACTLNLQEDMQVARALSDAADALDVVRETNANLGFWMFAPKTDRAESPQRSRFAKPALIRKS